MLNHLSEIKQDSIMTLMTEFSQDPRQEKIELGIGVYKDELGNTPIMAAVKQAQASLLAMQQSKAYLGLAGNHHFNEATRNLLLGGSEAYSRACTIQTPGGSSALRLFAELAKHLCAEAKIWLPEQTFANHPFTAAAVGLEVVYYPYMDPLTQQINEAAMLSALKQASSNDLVLLHGCCHNPTGTDISMELWQALADMSNQNGFLPLIDLAYQGFGESIASDISGMRLIANQVANTFIAVSYSKNMGLYRERTGAAVVVSDNQTKSQLIKNHLLQIANGSYAMPPDHGAAVVAEILNNQDLYALWDEELAKMSARLKELRRTLVKSFNALGNSQFDYISSQRGLFSLTNLDLQQIQRLKSEFAIYVVPGGRINIAGVSLCYCDYLASAIHQVVQGN